MKRDIGRKSLHFFWAYILVTVACYSLSYLVSGILALPTAAELGISVLKDPVFLLTVPYHVLINVLVWMIFAYLYFRKRAKTAVHIRAAISLGVFWLVMAMLTDFAGFVLIKTPFSLSAYQFYIEYQPWISLTYLAVFLSPILCVTISGISRKYMSCPGPITGGSVHGKKN